MIATPFHQIVQPRSLAPQHQHAIPRKVEAVVVARAPFIQPDNPKILPLQFFQCPHQIHHARNAQVLCGSSARLHRNRAQRSRPPFRQHHAIHARAIGYAQQGSKILRILDPIQRQQQSRRARLPRIRLKQILNRQRLLRPHIGNHSLVRRVLGNQRQLLARLLPHTDSSLAALRHQLFQPQILPLARHQHVIKPPPSGPQCLFHRMKSVQNFHKG